MRLDTEASPGVAAAPVPHRWAISRRRLRAAAVLAGLAGAGGCGRKPPAPPAPQPVATVTMRPQPTSLTQQYPAQLEASNTVEIRPQVAGILYRQAALEGA